MACENRKLAWFRARSGHLPPPAPISIKRTQERISGGEMSLLEHLG